MANIDYQLNRIYNHLADRSLGTSVKEFLDWVIGSGKTHPNCGHPQYWGLGSQTEWKAKNNLSTGFISLCFLTVCAMQPAAHVPAAMPFFCDGGLHPQTVSQSKQNTSYQLFGYSNEKSTEYIRHAWGVNIRVCCHTWSLGACDWITNFEGDDSLRALPQ